MYVNVAVLKETQPHERRVALVPSVVAQADQAGREAAHAGGRGRCHQAGRCRLQGCRVHRDRNELVADADVVLAVQPPALGRDRRDEGRRDPDLLHLCDKEPALVQRLLDKKITCFAMERVPRITRAQSMDALSSQSALAGYYAVQLGATISRASCRRSRRPPARSGRPRCW
jgi:NAD(P) transhydrogenase subunit alpha